MSVALQCVWGSVRHARLFEFSASLLLVYFRVVRRGGSERAILSIDCPGCVRRGLRR